MSQKRPSVIYSVNKDVDEQDESPYTPNFIAAGLDANVDDRRADFSTSWVQSVNQFSNTKEDAARRGLSQEAVRKSVSEDDVRKASPPLEHDYLYFMLDAFALLAPELDATVEVLLAKPTWYWRHLGETYEQRAAAHQERVTAKALWALEIRKGLQRALNDVRCYRPDPVADILVPSSKRRRSPDQSGCMRCAIHCQPPPEADD